ATCTNLGWIGFAEAQPLCLDLDQHPFRCKKAQKCDLAHVVDDLWGDFAHVVDEQWYPVE
ncbi:hypothetical protein L0F63_005467, partial [Massospora cicadina]